MRFVSIEQFDVPKLFIGDAENADFPKLWQKGLYPFAMNLCILHTGAMADVDGELEHGKTIL